MIITYRKHAALNLHVMLIDACCIVSWADFI